MQQPNMTKILKGVLLGGAFALCAPAWAQTADVPLDPLDLLALSGKLMRSDDPASHIPGSYIVVFNKAAELPPDFVHELSAYVASKHGLTVGHVYDRLGAGFWTQATPDDVLRLAEDPNVQYIVQDQTMSSTATQSSAPYHLDRVDQRNLPLNNSYVYDKNGSGSTVYVVDTGIRFGHSQFGGRAAAFFDWYNTPGRPYGCSGHDNDGNGHGTHVAGIIGGTVAGVAKAVTLRAVRVLSCSGPGAWSAVRAGLDAIAADTAARKVANLSLGGAKIDDINTVADQLVSQYDTVVVVSAGNENRDACLNSPASAPRGITVGATNDTDARWVSHSTQGSNYGSCLDLFAPGRDVVSAAHNSNSGTVPKTGTSMAAPVVAGVAAMYRQLYPSATAAQTITAIVGATTANKVQDPGTSSPNKLTYSKVTTAPIGGSNTSPNPGGNCPTRDPRTGIWTYCP